MKKYKNPKKESFLQSRNLPSLEEDNNDLALRCKFNFSYFDSSQAAGQEFHEWSHPQLIDLLRKLKEYSKKPFDYWKNQRIGKGGLKVLVIYGSFPNRSEFSHPRHVPHQAQWARFRLASKRRLVGFTIPSELHRTPHNKTGEFFDKNVFYVVFLDREHKFYLSENKYY